MERRVAAHNVELASGRSARSICYCWVCDDLEGSEASNDFLAWAAVVDE